ncbi:hypothetical protein BC629DRAFT_526032 [Irpex lacteus]|nr:hypothetical protein BC629DRAFT_526032 [Irpex lacteus]
MSHTQVKIDPEQIAAEEQLASKRDFSDKGLDSILDYHRQYLFDDRVFEKFFVRYSAASMAWMAAGMALDGEQEWTPGGFHKHFHETRKSTSTRDERKHIRNNLQWYAIDMLTALDRVSGGGTIMMHIDGNMRPGTPTTPEAMQPLVYFTPFIRHDIPNADIVIARLAQMFTECIAVPTVQRWEGAMVQSGVRLGKKTIGVGRRPYCAPAYDYDNPPPLLPPMRPKSSTYIIPGRPIGAVEKAIKHFHPELVDRTTNVSDSSQYSAPPPSSSTRSSERSELHVLSSQTYKQLQAEYEDVQTECEDLDKQLVESRARVAYLEKQVAARNEVLCRLSQDAQRLLDNVELAIGSDFDEVGMQSNSNADKGKGKEVLPAITKAIDGSEADASQYVTADEGLDSPLRRLIRLSRPGSSPPVHTIPLRRSPSWEEIRPFGKASEVVIDRRNMWREHLHLPHIRGILNDAEHKKWYGLLMRYTMEAPKSVRELVEAMHTDAGLNFDEAYCTEY